MLVNDQAFFLKIRHMPVWLANVKYRSMMMAVNLQSKAKNIRSIEKKKQKYLFFVR